MRVKHSMTLFTSELTIYFKKTESMTLDWQLQIEKVKICLLSDYKFAGKESHFFFSNHIWVIGTESLWCKCTSVFVH